MQTRYRAAATALLLTATAGLAATGGAADASGTHHTGDRAAKTLTITIKSKGHSLKLSDSRFRPGNTIFKILPHGKGGDMQVVRLKAGYGLAQANQDVGAAFGGDLAAIKRVDTKIVWYGGNSMSPKGGDPTYWGVKIDKPGKYYVLNIDSNALTTFKAKGATQKRSLPKSDGWLNMATTNNGAGNKFKVGKNHPKHGWMKTTNHALEPHFAELNHVKRNTTPQDVSNYFNDPNAPQVPPFAAKDGSFASSGILSPGKTMVWSYGVTKGKYLVACFWPSKETGMPHAFMGMWKLFDLG